MIYLDSSVLLEHYLSQPRADEARQLLAHAEAHVSSYLIAVEVPVVLRRCLGASKADATLLERALRAFDGDLETLYLASSLPEVAQAIRRDPRFSACRALDAIHAATALVIQGMAAQQVTLATFDERLGQLGRAVGLTVMGV